MSNLMRMWVALSLVVTGLAVGLSAYAAPSVSALEGECEPNLVDRPTTGDLFTSVWGSLYGGDSFVAPGESGNSSPLTGAAVWMHVPTDAALRLEVIEGDAIDGTVVGVAETAGASGGRVEVEFSPPLDLVAGQTYILKVSSPGSTQGMVQRTTNIPGQQSYYDGGAGDRRSDFNLALSLGFCGATSPGAACDAADHPPLALSRPSNGSPFSSIHGAFYAADAVPGVDGRVRSVSTFLSIATDSELEVSLIEGTDVNATPLAVAEAPGGATGQVTAVFEPAVPVQRGTDYILKFNAPDSTTGMVFQTDQIEGQESYYDGGAGDKRSPWNIAMQVQYECAGSLLDHGEATGSVGEVYGSAFVGQEFDPLDRDLANIGVRLSEANNGPLTVTVREGALDGPVVGTETIPAGSAGLRQVEVSPPLRLESGAPHFLVVQSGDVATTSGAVAAGDLVDVPLAVAADGVADAPASVRLWFLPDLHQGPSEPVSCTSELTLDQSYLDSVEDALRAKTDTWGEELIDSPAGPTYDGIKDVLKPLFHVGSPAGVQGPQLTDSGVYYLALGHPTGAGGGSDVALHVADGSQVISRSATGAALTFFVDESERFGQCLATLEEPGLRDGYLPVLEVSYTDQQGVVWTQESFVERDDAGVLTSFIKVTATSPEATEASLHVRLPGTNHSLVGGQVRSQGEVAMLASDGGSLAGSDWVYDLDLTAGVPAEVYVARPHHAIDPDDWPAAASAARHEAELLQVEVFWDAILDDGADISVPEQRVMDAMRNLLIQNVQLGWRYSLGNAYEQFFQPEGSDAIQSLGEFGYPTEHRSGLLSLLEMTKGPTSYQNWEWGEKMAHAAQYYRMTGDVTLIEESRAAHRSFVDDLAGQQATDPNGLLRPQAYSGDIPDQIYGIHHIGPVWRGLRDIALVWAELGHAGDAAAAANLAEDLGSALDDAIEESTVEVDEDALFVPERLLADVDPYDPITATKFGSYYNLVAHYGYGAGLLTPGSREARGVLDYLYSHGSLLGGLLRFNYYPTGIGDVTPGGLPGYKTSGFDNVYGVQLAQFMADNDEADRLVLSLYGKLAHGMTRGTFVSGEGDTAGPVEGEYYRSMYLPPSSANNTYFLKIVRSMLVHEVVGDDGEIEELRIAHATPRAWMQEGKKISFTALPTMAGPVSLEMVSAIDDGEVTAQLTLPAASASVTTKLRVRLPDGHVIAGVSVNGAPHEAYDAAAETVDLTGLTGEVSVIVTLDEGEVPTGPVPASLRAANASQT